MVIIWGSRLMGKVDVVPGLFHVATRFGHLNFLPLVPMGTYLILSQDGSGFRGMPIGFSFKSMMMAWVRTGLFIAAVIVSILAMVEVADGKNQSWVIRVSIAVGLWAVFALTWHRIASRASFRRACQLGELVGLNEEGFALLQQIYGEAVPGGFPVGRSMRSAAPIPAMPMTPPPMPMRAHPVFPQAESQQAYSREAIPLERAPDEREAMPQQRQQSGQLGL